MFFTMVVKDKLSQYSICSIKKDFEKNILFAEKYIEGENFGVIQELINNVGVVVVCGSKIKMKLQKNVNIGEKIAKVGDKILYASEDGKLGDIINTQVIWQDY